MEILLAILLLLVVLIVYLIIQNKKLKQQAITLSKEGLFLKKKEIEFIEFTVDMYIKYSEELDIHSKDQHEFIVAELERIRKEILIPKIKNDN